MAKRYGLVFDTKRCIGCRTCVIACKAEKPDRSGLVDEGVQQSWNNDGYAGGSIPPAQPLMAGQHLHALRASALPGGLSCRRGHL